MVHYTRILFQSIYPNTNIKYLESKKLNETIDFDRFKKIEIINCSYNNINNLENIPSKLKELNCSHNQIICLDNLPQHLIDSDYSNNIRNFI